MGTLLKAGSENFNLSMRYIIFVLILYLFLGPSAYATTGPGTFPWVCIVTDPIEIADLGCVLGNLIVWLQIFGALAAMVGIVIGGFRYMSAGSDKYALGSAQKTITLSIAGLILILMAYVVVRTAVWIVLGLPLEDLLPPPL